MNCINLEKAPEKVFPGAVPSSRSDRSPLIAELRRKGTLGVACQRDCQGRPACIGIASKAIRHRQPKPRTDPNHQPTLAHNV